MVMPQRASMLTSRARLRDLLATLTLDFLNFRPSAPFTNKPWKSGVAAALEKRPYDILKVMPAVAAATFANIGAISGQMDAAAEEFRKRDQENIERAYAEEGQGN